MRCLVSDHGGVSAGSEYTVVVSVSSEPTKPHSQNGTI